MDEPRTGRTDDASVWDTQRIDVTFVSVSTSDIYETVTNMTRFRLSDAPQALERWEAIAETLHSKNSRLSYRPFILNYLRVAQLKKRKWHDLALFRGWVACLAQGASPDKPASESTLRVATAAVGVLFKHGGKFGPLLDGPTNQWFKTLRYHHAAAPRQAAPILKRDIIKIVRTMRALGGLEGLRNAALLLLGWHGAMRRSEIARVHCEHLQAAPSQTHLENAFQGAIILTVPASKGDRKKVGLEKPLYRSKDPEFDCIAAIDEWKAAAGITSGPLFRVVDRVGKLTDRMMSAQQVYQVFYKHYRDAGVSPHSLRSGYITHAALVGRTLPQIMVVSGHKDIATVARYLRKVNAVAQGPGPVV